MLRRLLNKGFKFQPNVCNGSHDLLTMSVKLSDIAFKSFKTTDYHCIICVIRRIKPINLMQIIELTKNWKLSYYI